MTDALEFTDEEIRIIEGLYTATDSAERRQFVRDALDLQPGEDVVSIGCGPGFETASLAECSEALSYCDDHVAEMHDLEQENEDAFERVRDSSLKPQEPIQ